MRKVLLFVVAFALIPTAIAVAESTGLKVTGGGQVTAGGGNGGGPGDTIAFNAQQIAPAPSPMEAADAKGELQVNNRFAGTRFHGDVTCIRTVTFDQGDQDPSNDQTYIRFGGYQKVRGKVDPTAPFTVDTQDNGEGKDSDDQILFRQRDDSEDPCDDNEIQTQLRSMMLARGNVQAHNEE